MRDPRRRARSPQRDEGHGGEPGLASSLSSLWPVAPTGRARCRACKGLVACGAVRLVTLAVVSEWPRRVTTFVCHGTCVNGRLAAMVLGAHGDADNVPVIGDVSAEEVERVRVALRHGIGN